MNAHMNTIPQGGDAQKYINAMFDVWPLFAAGGGAAILFGASRIKAGMKQSTKKQLWANLTLQAILQGLIGTAAGLMSELVWPDISPTAQLGIVLFCASYGAGLVLAFIKKKLGLQMVDLMSAEDIEAIRDSMPEEMRQQHAAQCPFKADMPENIQDR